MSEHLPSDRPLCVLSQTYTTSPLFKSKKIHPDPPALRRTVSTDAPLLTKWQMGCGGFLTRTSKLGQAGASEKPGHRHSFRPPRRYFWRTYRHERKVCWKGDRSGVWRGQKWKNTNGGSAFSFHLDTPSPPSASHLSSSCFSFIASHVIVFLSFLLRPALYLPPLLPVHLLPPFPSPPLLHCLLSFMSLWPWSHFPNWLSGSLIILWHSCCRLFYLSACRRPNPLISKHPSSAHAASQQPAAFPANISKVHTDGPSTSRRHAKQRMTLRAAHVKEPLEFSSSPSDSPKNFWLSCSS